MKSRRPRREVRCSLSHCPGGTVEGHRHEFEVRRMPRVGEREKGGRYVRTPARDSSRVVNATQTQAEQEAVRAAMYRGWPYGGDGWVGRTAVRLGLEGTLRPRGRPAKAVENGS